MIIIVNKLPVLQNSLIALITYAVVGLNKTITHKTTGKNSIFLMIFEMAFAELKNVCRKIDFC
jgi:hypothetical protein